MATRVTTWINEVNTTSFRIIVSVGLAGFTVIVCLIGVTFINWLPTDPQITVLKGIGAGLLLMMGLDVAQFIGKRFSDAGYAAAKSTPAVAVGGPSTVQVDSAAGGTAAVAVSQPAPPLSAPAPTPREPERGE